MLFLRHIFTATSVTREAGSALTLISDELNLVKTTPDLCGSHLSKTAKGGAAIAVVVQTEGWTVR